MRGNGVPDAHIASLMVSHGVDAIWSRDRNFRMFADITTLDPFSDRYAGGFTAERRRRR